MAEEARVLTFLVVTRARGVRIITFAHFINFAPTLRAGRLRITLCGKNVTVGRRILTAGRGILEEDRARTPLQGTWNRAKVIKVSILLFSRKAA